MELMKRAVVLSAKWSSYLLAAAVLALLLVGAYHKHFPVVVSAEGEIIDMGDSWAVLEITGTKARCLSLITSGAHAPKGWGYSADGRRHPVSMRPMDETNPTTYPCGPNNFGQYRFESPRRGNPPVLVAYSVAVAYDDGVFGLIHEEIGPMRVR